MSLTLASMPSYIPFVLHHPASCRPSLDPARQLSAFPGRSNNKIRSLCLCAIVPLCFPPNKAKIAKQVPARCGHLVELHVKKDRCHSAFVLLCLCAFRQKNSKDFKLSTIIIKTCAFVPLCPLTKTKIAKTVPARCGQLIELHLKSDSH